MTNQVKVDSGSADSGSHAGVMLIVAALVLAGGVFGFAVHKYGIDEVKAVLGSVTAALVVRLYES